MAPTKQDEIPQSMRDGLNDLLPDIAVVMAAPDADIDFLKKLQDLVLLKIHSPSGRQPQGPGGSAAPGPAAPGGESPAAPGTGIPGAGIPGGPPGGGAPNGQMVSQGAPAPPMQPGGVSGSMKPQNPDEMRRILAEAAGPG